MDATLERMAREAGVSDVADLRRHDVGPALQAFAALVAERCASIAIGHSLDGAAKHSSGTPQEMGAEIAEAIRTAFPMPRHHGPTPG